MQKELNHNLFPQQNEIHENSIHTLTPPVETLITKAVTASEEVHLLRIHMHRLQEQLSRISQHILEQSKTTQVKFERTAQAISRVEHTQVSFSQDTSEKIATISSRILERKSVDVKIQELIEQQNNLIKINEERMQKFSKSLSEKEIQINCLTQNLQEAQMEIQKLKRINNNK